MNYSADTKMDLKIDFIKLLALGDFDEIRKKAALYTASHMEEIMSLMSENNRNKLKTVIEAVSEGLKTGNGIIKNQVYRDKIFKECRITTFYKCEFYDCTFKWNHAVHFNDCILHNCCILKSVK